MRLAFIVVCVAAGGATVALLGVALIYNRLVKCANRYKNAFSQIDVQLTRRFDLIPNLVETAKAYMKHERSTLEAVIQARTQAQAAGRAAAAQPGDPSAIQGLIGAEVLLNGTMGRFFALVENYPDLKASRNMSDLMESLTSTENKVAFARQAYNDSVMTYNTARETFPAVLFAGMLGFARAELYEIEDDAQRAAPDVALGN